MKVTFAQEMQLCRALLAAQGMSAEDAEILGSSVAHSDFTGIYSHGLSRFSNYLKRFANGAMKPDAALTITNDTGSTVAYDCDNGCGVVSLTHVYRQMAPRAKEYGIVIACAPRLTLRPKTICAVKTRKRSVSCGTATRFPLMTKPVSAKPRPSTAESSVMLLPCRKLLR